MGLCELASTIRSAQNNLLSGSVYEEPTLWDCGGVVDQGRGTHWSKTSHLMARKKKNEESVRVHYSPQGHTSKDIPPVTKS